MTTNQSKPRRRWLQYSLRTMLVLGVRSRVIHGFAEDLDGFVLAATGSSRNWY